MISAPELLAAQSHPSTTSCCTALISAVTGTQLSPTAGEMLLSQVPAPGAHCKYHKTKPKRTLHRQAHDHSCPARSLFVPKLQLSFPRTNSQGTRDFGALLCWPRLCTKGFAALKKASTAIHSSCSDMVHQALGQHEMTLPAGMRVLSLVQKAALTALCSPVLLGKCQPL